MQRKPNPRTLAFGFLALSALLSVAVLATRNLYDDEISSFDYITQPFSGIIHALSQGDVHPPGMYLLAHLAYSILPSFRWLNLFPLLVFYAGLSLFVLSVAPTFISSRSRILFLLLATLHPQLLMWGNTFRWYSWWTGLALIALVVSLQPRILRSKLTIARALSVGLLLGCLFYLNYITLLFAVALTVAMFVRYRREPRRHLVICASLTLLVFAALIAPQLHTMFTVHIPNSEGQRSSIFVSLFRLLLSLTASEAFLPWHPLAIAAVAAFAALCVAPIANSRMSTARLLKRQPAPSNKIESPTASASSAIDPASSSGLCSILLCASLFLVLVVASGLGGKPRNGLLLIPILAPAAAVALGTLRPRLQTAALLFFAIWSAIGLAHLLGRYGLTKATMDDRPEQVVAFVQRTTGNACPLVITYDTELLFALSQSRLPGLILVSGTGEPIFMKTPQATSNCTLIRLYAVRSYLGEPNEWAADQIDELTAATHVIQGAGQTDRFSPDPDAPIKRRLAHLFAANGDLAAAAGLPDYRYAVTSGAIDPRALPALLRAMPYYVSSSAPTPVAPAKP